MTAMPVTTDSLRRLVQRIVQVAQPERIILFGSAARGEMRPDSDIDVLVVMPNGTHRLNTTLMLYREVRGTGAPVDFIVATPDVLEKHRDNGGLIYKAILKEGRDLYVAEPA
jgi:predicted nucleotidyltransferase